MRDVILRSFKLTLPLKTTKFMGMHSLKSTSLNKLLWPMKKPTSKSPTINLSLGIWEEHMLLLITMKKRPNSMKITSKS